MKKAFALRNKWKQAIKSEFICAVIALVVGLCIVGLMGELGIFIAVPLLMPVTIHFGLSGLRLLLQGDPVNEFLDFRQERCKR